MVAVFQVLMSADVGGVEDSEGKSRKAAKFLPQDHTAYAASGERSKRRSRHQNKASNPWNQHGTTSGIAKLRGQYVPYARIVCTIKQKIVRYYTSLVLPARV